jgi:outer membrane receptor protein involved in Fe transport
MRALLLATAALAALASPAVAQGPAGQDMAETDMFESSEIIVTATRRAQALSDVPIAVSAVTAESLQNSGASDIRQLNQLAPSLLVSSTSSEAGAGVARIRGIGTVGDNPGLESSVAVFVDGVYRSRSGAALTELGAIERIEVLRGPQGTLFGRNASAGLINIITRQPSFDVGGEAEVSYGNFNAWRLQGGVTGPIAGDTVAGRLDAVYVKRDGFMTDVISGRTVNDRDRWLVRGQLRIEPSSDVSIRLIGDYAKRQEECCASAYLPFRSSIRQPDGSVVISAANPVVNLIRGLGGVTQDDTYARLTSITPGRDYRSDVEDWGLSGELNWRFDNATLTSITAYRSWNYGAGQDADFNSLDVLYRDDQQRRFRTFTQEVRLQGSAFNDRLDWLIGGYFANEKLLLRDNLKYGADYDRYADALVRLSIPTFPGFANLQPFVQGFLIAQGVPPAAAAPVAGVVQNLPPLANSGIVEDRYEQESRNFAVFTHNVIDLVPDRLSLTLGLRYTNERKTLDADLRGNNLGCATLLANVAALNQFNGTPLQPAAAGAQALLTQLAGAPCVIPPILGFTGSDRRSEEEWSGTVVLSYKATPELLTYASYSKGYKAGGFNLDRSGLNPAGVNLSVLQFEPEFVDSFEVGAKLDLRRFRLNVAAFYAVFDQFQLNTFNGTNFVVENIQGCRDDLLGGDRDFPPTFPNAATTGRCDPDRVRGGVTSKGFEIEAAVFPAPNLSFNLGYTYADTRYRSNLTGIGGQPLSVPLFNIPGQALSNASPHVQTGAVTWTPPLTDDISALFYLDYRFQSELNTGSDLFPEKKQVAFTVVNARIGINSADRRWSIEGWAQNLFDEKFQQVAFNTPLQGSGTFAQTVRGGPNATTLFGSFLGEPRTFGVTLRTRF